MTDYNDLKVAIIGLGYVGLPLAVEFAKQRRVIGFDTNLERISDLKLGLDSTLEVTEEELKKVEIKDPLTMNPSELNQFKAILSLYKEAAKPE